MQHLHRQLAPISEAGWDALENEAQETLRATLIGRRLFDVTDVSPQQAGVNLGQTSPLQHSGVVGVEASARRVQPLIQLRTPFSVPREDLEVADRSQGVFQPQSAHDFRRAGEQGRNSQVTTGSGWRRAMASCKPNSTKQ